MIQPPEYRFSSHIQYIIGRTIVLLSMCHYTREFVEAVCSDEDRLLRYLFSDKSFIMTGNDNDGTTPHINVDYEHEEYEKWN